MIPVIHQAAEDRRKSVWRASELQSRSTNSKIRDATSRSPAFGPRSSSPAPGNGHGEKKKSILSGKLFSSKRRGSNASAVPPPSHVPAVLTQPNQEAIARGVDILQSIFRKWDRVVLQMMLETNAFIMEDTITAILNMEEAEEESNLKREQANGLRPRHAVKNPLPDDFLRLPDDFGEDALDEEREDDEEMTGDERPSELLDDDCRPSLSQTDDLESKATHSTAGDTVTGDDQSEKSSVFAEDDGTLYGKEFASDDEELKEDVVIPVLDSETIRKSNQIVSDSMNKKFLPEELRDEGEQRQSIVNTSHIDIIKRSRLDLTEAEKRIRHREPHLVFELLSKASEIYRQGVISSQELELLRSMIVSKIQPSKMLIDMTMNMDKMISDHEWHSLLLKAKGIRQALSIRFINNVHRTTRSHGHVEYVIRVVDVETGVVWFTKKRFKELHKLYRKLCRFSQRISDCPFPARRNHGRSSVRELASDRAPVLEAFLRVSASLVTPPPMTFLHGCALKQLQQFLDVPHEGILLRNRTQPISRELRVYIYHTVNDPTSPEGKACAKFLLKLKQNGVDPDKNLVEEVGAILDGVQEYMLEHRFDEMRNHVERLMKYYSTTDLAEDTFGRRNSYVNLLASDDVLTSNDKLQQLVSDAIRHELEEKICVPLMNDLLQFLTFRVAQKEQLFRQRVFQLRGKPQSYFGIPVSKISLSSWRSVIELIKEIDDAFLPLDKMRKLVATAHHIHSLHRSERRMYRAETTRALIRMSLSDQGIVDSSSNQQQGESPTPSSTSGLSEDDVLGGDDFLPIFIYVIVHSDLAAPIMTQVLLNRLCDPEKRRSESGYYLATFEAALHHILSGEAFEQGC